MKFRLSIFFSLFALSMTAQIPSGYEADWNWGREHEIDGDQSIADIDDQFIYAYAVNNGEGFDRRKWIYTKYDNETFDQIWSFEIDPLEYEDSELSFFQVNIIEGEFYVFYTGYDKHEDEVTMLVQIIDADGNMGELIPLLSHLTDDPREGTFEVIWSHDQDNFALVSIPQFVDDERARFRVSMYDRLAYEVWSNEQEIDTHHENFKVVDYALGIDDHFYALAYRMPDLEKGEEDVDGMSNQSYALYKINQNTITPERLDLELDNFFIQGPWIVSDTVGTYIGCIYSEEDFGYSDGLIFMNIDLESFSVASRSQSVVPEIIQERLQSNRGWANLFDDFGAPFEPIYFLRTPDGGAVIVEQVRYEEITYEPTVTIMGVPVSYRRIVTNHYEDFLVMKLDASSQVEWMSHLPLNQIFVESTLLMGTVLTIGEDGKFHLIFNDDKDNVEEWSDSEPRIDSYTAWSVRRGNVMMVTFDLEGDFQYESIAKSRDDDGFYFIPNASFSREPGKIAVFSMEGEDVKIGTLEIYQGNF
ncbi:MAG: hypothetical protein HWD92_12845 [Flavobacteriia bacterium]|nr:hypothetical protein [Flavobacteriia bacterium]